MLLPRIPATEIRWPRRVLTPAEAVKYVNALGYCVLFPVNNVPLPSLYYAVTRRDWHDEFIWDKYSRMVWRWKDELPRRRRFLYAKYFRGRGTLVSLEYVPYFLAVSEAPSHPGDHEAFYAAGRIRDDARVIWKVLEQHGPAATLELRHACKMDTKAGNVRFKRAIAELQCMLAVVHFGNEQETGAWASGRYELTCRAFQKETVAASRILRAEALAKLAAKYLEWRPDAPPTLLARLFSWSMEETESACASADTRRRGASVKGGG